MYYPDYLGYYSSKQHLKYVLLVALFVIIVLFGTLIFLAVVAPKARADTPPATLWKGLIAEACSEGYEGMYAVACVVCNRLNSGLSHGLCGLKRRDLDGFVSRQGKEIECIAKSIVEEVFERGGVDVTHGAIHYENIERFGKPYWVKGMTVTTKIKRHTFFKQ